MTRGQRAFHARLWLGLPLLLALALGYAFVRRDQSARALEPAHSTGARP